MHRHEEQRVRPKDRKEERDLGWVGRRGKNGDKGKVPHIVVLYQMRRSRSQIAIRNPKMVKTVFNRVFHFFFKKRKSANGIVVVLLLLFADLLNKHLLDAGKNQSRHIVEKETRGGEKNDNAK